MKAAHFAQSRPQSCVAACVCIARRLRGEAPSSAELEAESSGPAPSTLAAVAALPEAYRLNGATADDDLRAIQVALASGDLVVVLVLCGPYASWLGRRYPGLSSPHGPLALPSPFGGGLHAIVLAGRTHRRIAVLDPFFPSQDQPLWIDDEDLALVLGSAGIAVPR